MVTGIDNLIICNPYKRPDQYYRYDSKNNRYFRTKGRRPSGYQSMDENGRYGIHQTIDSVNDIRPHIEKWRDGGYPGATATTKRLLRHWIDRDESRLFFCQIEAIESIIYASAHSDVVDRLIDGDGSSFMRYCTKMATGTGKTIVMGMLIAWHALNTGPEYAKNILVVTPNLTVRDRLQVLRPSHPNNIYDEFDLIPAGLRDRLGSIRITITNFHQLQPKSSPTRTVAKLGKQGPRSFGASIVGKGVSNILVINDEGHHAWRPSKYQNSNGAANKEKVDAGLWTSGLDLLHQVCTIMRCHDFSATPFVPTGKSSTGETLFGWIISDFSLWDAIESGLVKTPQTPKQGDRFYHLYRQEGISAALSKGSMPNLVTEAYQLLGNDWQQISNEWSQRSTPPVMITVCNNTKHAKLVARQFESNKHLLNKKLVDPKSLLHIDSDAIKAISSDEGRKEIREKVSTVGKPGRPGENVCNIVSVDMLTEGWDARTVTHIMGLRAFKSQLLCEQVVGRGLRRTSYDITNSDGLFEPEYVCVLGVPFAGILSETTSTNKPTSPPKPPCEVYPDKLEHIIAWPIVSKITDIITVHMDMDWSGVTPRQFDDTPPPSHVVVGPVVDGWVASDTSREITSSPRMQTVIYDILRSIMRNLNRLDKLPHSAHSPYNGNPQQITLDILAIVKEYVAKYVKTRLDEEELAQMLYAYRDVISKEIFSHLTDVEPESEPKAVIDGTGSTDIPRRFTTKKRQLQPKKTHLNLMTADSDLEIIIGRALDDEERVTSWAKSDMAGFVVPYLHPEYDTERIYKPDFVAHLDNGVSLVIEGKGKTDDVDKAKNNALKKWVRAVNLDGRYGVWHSYVIRGNDDIRMRLDDAIRSAGKIRYVQACDVCGASTDTPSSAAEVFGLKKQLGILGFSALCKKCRA